MLCFLNMLALSRGCQLLAWQWGVGEVGEEIEDCNNAGVRFEVDVWFDSEVKGWRSYFLVLGEAVVKG